jgi:acetyl esterase/lipase
MVMGNRFAGISEILGYLENFDAVCVSVEYRLAPAHQDSAPIEDCFTGLKWMAKTSSEFGIGSETLIVAGSFAGGGLAAGVSLPCS